MIARGLGYPQVSEMVKALFVEEAETHFGVAGKRVTDSRISVLTGLQRRDVRAHRGDPREDAAPRSHGPIPRIMALWTSDPRFGDDDGRPSRLPRAGDAAPSFEALVREVGRDVHPRTVLDEMLRLGLVVVEDDGVRLVADAVVTGRDDALLLAYFGANLGDHAEAAAANLMAAPEPSPFYERAVHYNKLTPAALTALDVMARERQQALLEEINAAALSLQRADTGDKTATERFRLGAYIYRSVTGSVGE